MSRKTYRSLTLESIGEQDGSCLTIEHEYPVSSPHLKLWVKRMVTTMCA